ncbi:type III pantothenate kinase [Pseudoduganella albidiflava]|uniref:Type III pantothenate kinase n=1 Tax=Pseudoduganella albidiflava TaxID=321983 RepID=A0A411X468_9BURK|nr:type III pantothenate kinase [Pseudoduganella albidiflava]QBI03668.1 type III pantothenate kinase [Pseudoduganella albidiflava]GGY51850.1 type III pantothenate kinase [Pseudoduganella albidiflava]
MSAGAATWLVVDAGNTRVKWALADAGAPAGQWRLHGAMAHGMLDTLAGEWQAAGIGPVRVLVANVAGGGVRAAIEGALRICAPQAAVEWFASVPWRAGILNGYANPAQLGCDRFAAAIGARALAPRQDLVIANCGTATTIDAVTADGTFIGGMILPGLRLMSGALARNTAQLPQIDAGTALPPTFAGNTHDAILSGCLAAQAGAIERAIAAHGGAPCIISGGAAPLIAPVLNAPARHVDNIVMLGLHAALLAGEMDETC